MLTVQNYREFLCLNLVFPLYLLPRRVKECRYKEDVQSLRSLTSSNLNIQFTETFKPGEFVVLKFVLGLFSFFGFAKNAAVIVVFLTSNSLRDIPSNWFVLSLAIGDALFCVYASVIFIYFHQTKHLSNALRSLWYVQSLTRISYLTSPAACLF